MAERAISRWRRFGFALAIARSVAGGTPDVQGAGAQAELLGSGKGGIRTLVVAAASDAITIYPFDVSVTTPDAQIELNMYDALVDLDRNGQVMPALATSWARANPTTIRFQLRQGVKFHHGEDFTAEDVKFTFDSVRDPAQKHKRASLLSFVDRVEVLDRFTVQLVTKKPEAMVIRVLATEGIVSAVYARAHPEILNTKPNGTGSYRFVEWVKDDHLTMEAFDGGWRGAPAVKRVTWRAIKDDAARVAALVTGEIDVAHSVPTDLIPLVARSARAEVRTAAAASGSLRGTADLPLCCAEGHPVSDLPVQARTGIEDRLWRLPWPFPHGNPHRERHSHH